MEAGSRWGEGHAGCRSRNGSEIRAGFGAGYIQGPCKCPAFLARSGRQRRWLCEGGKGKGIERSRRRGQCGGSFCGFRCVLWRASGAFGFWGFREVLVYMKMYFRMKSSARTYIMGLIFFALPVTALTAT